MLTLKHLFAMLALWIPVKDKGIFELHELNHMLISGLLALHNLFECIKCSLDQYQRAHLF